MSREDRAAEFFRSGCNCAQSVAGAFGDVLHDEETLLDAASAFGGGFARTRGLCGALAGLGLVLGLAWEKTGDRGVRNGEIYLAVQGAAEEFAAAFGSTCCGELLKGVPGSEAGGRPAARTAGYYASRPCERFVRYAVRLCENVLEQRRDDGGSAPASPDF